MVRSVRLYSAKASRDRAKPSGRRPLLPEVDRHDDSLALLISRGPLPTFIHRSSQYRLAFRSAFVVGHLEMEETVIVA